jgi:hypothetical protein
MPAPPMVKSLQDVRMDARSVSAHSDMNGAAVITVAMLRD